MANVDIKSTSVKVTVVFLIVIAIFSIWIVKDRSKHAAMENTSDNPDFALHTKKLDLDKLKSYGLPIVIDFGADSCIPCKEMAPVLVELNKEYQGRVIVKFVDVWKYPEAAGNIPLQVIPTQFFFNADGSPLSRDKTPPFNIIGYTNDEDGKHAFTAHQGGLSKEQLVAVFKEMGIK